ncbi:MAG TPA: PspC domain-containing protein [Solirubrobacteraceae bacterium]|jgi:signal transduction histidine kinase
MASAPARAEQPALGAGGTALRRRPDRGLIGGVCAGIAEHFETDVLLVRVVAAMIVAVGGLGIAVYALGWALIPVAPDSAGLKRRKGAWRDAAVLLVAVGVLAVGLRQSGLRFGDAIVWPAVLGVCGLALVWRPIVAPRGETQPAGRSLGALLARARRVDLARARQVDLVRLAAGALLVAFASAGLLHSVGVQHSLGKAIGTVVIVGTISGLLILPSFVRLARSLSFERSARIREQERAEVAAHLHDSVLQTLALIQKRSAEPREVAGLARRQERELRSWLNEREGVAATESVAVALEQAAVDVEDIYGIQVEVVTVGDLPLDEHLEALVQAAREALTNAAKFAGSSRIDVYAELSAAPVEVFVRDRGVGFDPAAVPADRRGVRESIVGRMERHNGSAKVHSRPGAGTEVELTMEHVSST